MADLAPPVLKFAANLSLLFLEAGSIPSRYTAAKQSGFLGAEIVNPYEFATKELAKAKEDAQIEQALLHAFVGETKGLAVAHNRLEEFRQCLELSIQYCNALKCTRLHVPAGLYPEGEEMTDELKAICHERYTSSLRYAAHRLEQENITLLIEPIPNVPNYFLSSTGQAIDVINELNSPNVKLILNLSHHQKIEGNVSGTLTQYLDLIGYIRLHETSDEVNGEKHEDVNYSYVFNLLMNLGYKEWIGCDCAAKESSGSSTSRFGCLERYLQAPGL